MKEDKEKVTLHFNLPLGFERNKMHLNPAGIRIHNDAQIKVSEERMT
jgi:tRNA(Leu) C34 or U34 (ribose-2'-O)-methylase TrmL